MQTTKEDQSASLSSYLNEFSSVSEDPIPCVDLGSPTTSIDETNLDGNVLNDAQNDESIDLSLPESFDQSYAKTAFTQINIGNPIESSASINTELLLFCNSAKIKITNLQQMLSKRDLENNNLRQRLQTRLDNLRNLSLSEV